MSQQKPSHEIKVGRVKATIWKNDTAKGTFYNVTLRRLYKENDEWKSTDSFGRDDLPLVMKVSDLAHMWVYEQAAV